MEYLTGREADGLELGTTLAEVHRSTAATFGWPRDNLIGALPQCNAPLGHWPTFYVERRIRPLLAHLPDDLRGRLDRACDGPMVDLIDHDTVPSLVHGDLWSGNILAGRWLIDPAVHHADREFELAFAALFGGLPPRLLDGYLQAFPLDEGWQRRRPALQLYHLLVHVAMFGPTWLTGVRQRLDTLGW
jgi:fructosamine-3-kinase